MVTVHWQGCIDILQFLFIADLEVHLPMSSYFYNRIVACNGEHRL